MKPIIVQFDPVIFSLGPLDIRWYGLMYVVGFVVAGFLMKRLVTEGIFQIPMKKIDSLMTHALIGMFVGARVVYVFIYNWDYYSHNLIHFFSVWKGGLSFHGGVIGIAIGGYIFARKNKIHILHLFDCSAIAAIQGVFWGRLGNFINGELYGRVTDSPIGMIFPTGGISPRHPSQLYEAVFEGLVLFLIFWFLRKKVKVCGFITSIFFIGYGVFRYFIEFFREPDVQLGYYFGGTTTMGQILCLIMIVIGISLMILAFKKRFPTLLK